MNVKENLKIGLINHTNTINKLILVPNHHQTTIVASPMIQFDQPIHPVTFINS